MDRLLIVKTKPSLADRQQRMASRRGMALLLVLACLLLVTTMVVGLLLSSQNNLKSSKLYANGASVKTLADSTASLVMAQIQQATSNGTTVAWASQPGMIRTYDNTGAPLTNYRLFSWDTPTVSGAYDPSTDSSLLSSTTPSGTPWYKSPALYFDLNQPVPDSGGQLHYPIIDGNPSDIPSKTNFTTPSGASASTYTPFYTDPSSGNSVPPIEGFWVNQQNTATGPAVNTTATATPNNIPMPVKWLYVLQDGTVVAPTGNGNPQVTIKGASTTNPIVGRISYWTDDETTKVNINTASEGVFWDTPRADTNFERTNLANNQPAQNEFQRYPGHPATTCLSTVLGSIFPVSHTGATYTASQFLPYYALAPKLNVGGTSQTTNLGSNAGTVPPVKNLGTSTVAGTGALLFKSSDRLYNSVDELAFQSDLQNGLSNSEPGNAGVTATSGYTRTSTSNGVNNLLASANTTTNQFLEKVRFFLTSCSRAPDVNLFNQPRIGIWPVNATNDAAHRTVFDNTIAFCSTINKFPYYFQRQNSFDPAIDLPTMTSTTGLGRNRTLIQYLQNLTSQPVPGFGGDFVTKYTLPERDQILTEIFDYIRCQNLIDQNVTTPFAAVSPFASGYLGNGFYTGSGGIGQVVPILDTLGDSGKGTRGFGRFPTITEAALMFIVTGWNDNSNGHPSLTDPNYTSLNGALPWGYYPGTLAAKYAGGVNTPTAIQPGHVRVVAALIFSLFDPSQGFPSEQGCYQIGVENLEKFSWNGGGSMGFPLKSNALTNWPITSGTFGWLQQKWGGITDFRTMTLATGPGNPTSNFKYYPFFSDSIDLPYDPTSPASPTNPTPITFATGGPITVSMYIPTSKNWSPGTSLQTIKLLFPNSATTPVPTPFPAPVYAGPVTDSDGTHDMGRWDVRFGFGTNPYSPQSFLINQKDVVRSVRINTDARLVAATQNFDGTTGSSFTSYTGKETINLIHGLISSIGFPLFNASWGQLVPAPITYTSNGNPWPANHGVMDTLLSSGYCPTQGAFNTGVNILGDWDNGVGVAPDGPYINKADEGDFQYWDTVSAQKTVPYFDDWYSQAAISQAGQTFFSPNRLMPSPVMFGSLSTGVKRLIPWQTLLFCANPAGGNKHPGFGVGASGTPGPSDTPPYKTPPDHLLLDLFNMPVVEPYPITEPLSTAGRINMNYQIVPFTYIERSTGVRAVLKSERMTVIPDSDAAAYKNITGSTKVTFATNNYRVPINLDATQNELDSYFTTNKDIFRSASQICNIPLVPSQDANGVAVSLPFDSTTFWSTHRLTGDNMRERPYATIYPRLTTKSNTFTVHYCVETLKKVPGGTATVWDETQDQVTGQYRGSTTVERYVDPNDPNLGTIDFAALAAAGTPKALDTYYKFRVVSTKQFAP